MSRKLTEKEVLERITERHGTAITMSSYTVSGKEASFACNICGYEWKARPSAIINGKSSCYICTHKRIGIESSLNAHGAKERLYKKHQDNITLLEYGGNTHANSIFKCNRCNNIFTSSIHSVLVQRYACRKCWIVEMGKMKSGSKGNLWRGGITKLRPFIKCCLDNWKKLSMQECNYKCVACLDNHTFTDIHHLYSLTNIIGDALDELGYNEKERMIDYGEENIQTIVNKIIEIHFRHPLGVCLCKKSHTKFHELFGKKNNTPEQFYGFLESIKLREIIID